MATTKFIASVMVVSLLVSGSLSLDSVSAATATSCKKQGTTMAVSPLKAGHFDTYPKLAYYQTLQKGSKGDCVKTLQRYLNKTVNANLKIDGDFGADTYAAVQKFQTKAKDAGWKAGLASGDNRTVLVDGIVGQQTWALTKVYKKP